MDFAAVLMFWPALLRGFSVTLVLSVIAIVGGTALGLVVGLVLCGRNRFVKAPFQFYVYVFRGTPLLIQLFLIYLGLAALGVNLEVFTAAAIGFTLYSGAYTAEIVRSAIQALPAGQFEAADSLALTYAQKMTRVVIPQATKMAIPALVSFNLGLIKDTSLASIIGFVDFVKEAQAVIAATNQPFAVYLVVALGYFIICFPTSFLLARSQRRRERSERKKAFA